MNHRVVLLRGIGVASALVVALTGAAFVAAWLSGSMAARGAHAITVKTNTAVCLLLLGTGLLLLHPRWGRTGRVAGRACALVILSVGLVSLFENATGWNAGIDELLASEPRGALAVIEPNRMGLPASLAFALGGAAVWLLRSGTLRGIWAAQVLALAVLCIGLLGVIGYVYGVPPLYSVARFTGIAWPTAVALIFAGLALLLDRPDEGLTAWISSDDPGAVTTRRMIVWGVPVIIGLGRLRLSAQHWGWFGLELGTALLVLTFVVSFTVLVTVVGRQVGAAVAGRERAAARLRATFDQAGVGLVEVDLDDRIIAANERLCEILGYARDELLGLTVHELTWPEDRPMSDALNAELHAGRRDRVRYEKRYRRRDGEALWVHVTVTAVRDGQGRWQRSIASVEDISERRQAEAALQASESFYRQTLESIPGMVFTTRADGYCDYQSQQWQEYTGVPASEHVGVGWNRLLHPEDQARALAAWQAAVEQRAPYDLEYRVRRHDGQYEWFKVIGRPICDEAGNIARWFGVAANIQTLKETEARLADARAAAEQASRAKDHFLAVLSHELRTPLSPVVTALSFLQKNATLDAQAREDLELIRRNVELETRLIDDLLDVTRIARGKVELHRRTVALADVLRSAVEVCRPDLEARRLEFGFGAADDCLVQVDPTRLQQVFWNLLRNAIKFTPKGGCVGLRCRREGHEVLVEVSDSGIGIEPEMLGRLFNAFEQAERSITRQFGGLGLGLTISKALVEMHGGRIEAHSAGRGQGASFRVWLPLAAEAEPPDREPAATRPERARPLRAATGLRILLVEDHGDTAKMMALLLKLDGHQVERAADVTTALELAGRGGFDLLISDLGLPDASGLDLMRELRRRGDRIPGIALSGYGQETDVRRSLEVGFAAHLVKPADPEHLAEAIAAATA